MQRELWHEKTKRQAERKGRIRAEQQLKVLSQSTACNDNVFEASTMVQKKMDTLWPMQPIGTIASVFTQRCGPAALQT